MAVQHNDTQPAIPGAAIYVDTENLREPDLAQDVIAQTVADWPSEYPSVGSLSLYVRADKVALWRMWVEATYPELARRVRGVQHFSREMAKNSADLAITADAIGDLAAGQASYIAVISNDSDFGALFVKVREMASERGWDHSPFLWVTAPAGGGVSPEIERFIPDRFRWNLPSVARANPLGTWTPTRPRPPAVTRKPTSQPPAGASIAPTPVPAITPIPAATPSPTPAATPSRATVPAPKARPTAATPSVSADDIADELIRQLPVGRFKAGDAQKIIKAHWPSHPSADTAASFGQYLIRAVWPKLEQRGVVMTRTSSPRIYEITEAVKSSAGASAGPAPRKRLEVAKPEPAPEPRPAAAPSSSEPAPEQLTAEPEPAPAPEPRPAAAPSSSEPGPEQLAAEVAEGISEDVFKAAEAQRAIRERWPAHATASYSAQRFGIWFAEHLWPIMQAHGVQIATEKPRRYEMTPDARHRLVSQAIV